MLNVGLSNKSEKRFFYYDKYNSGLSSILKTNTGLRKKKIQLIRFDYCIKKYFKNHNINKNKFIDLVKIDAEGFEYNILKGMGKSIKKIKLIQFEFSFRNIDSKIFFKDFYNFFKMNNFDLYRMANHKPILIKNYNYNLESFIIQNYVAANKNFFKQLNE